MSIDENGETVLTADVLRKILDNCYDEIMAVDGTGKVIYANAGTERHSGLTASHCIGKHVSDLYGDGTWEPMATPIALKERKQITLRQVSPLGNVAITTSTPIFNQQGEIELIVHDTRDIKQLERMLQELASLDQQRQMKPVENWPEFRAVSKVMKEIVRNAGVVANVDANVLILGESGTGKGVLAKFIHQSSRRKEGPFIAVNCAAIPDELLESELFGYVGGAFTGATKGGKKGIIELADNGTLFLDEVSELSPRLQAKLLQYIQEKTFMPVGGTEIKSSDARLIAATNSDLHELIHNGKFRSDLFYRLDVIEITLPPLREREADVKDLVFFFLAKFNKKYDTAREIAPESMAILCGYFWPGNVRELENTIERLVITTTGNMIRPENLPGKITTPPLLECDRSFSLNLPLDLVIEEMEKNIITKTYKMLGSSTKVAAALSISQTKAFRLIKKYCDVETE